MKLHVVSRTELGVDWDPPLHDGGRPLMKYLVEWDTDRLMTSSIASPWNPYGHGIDGPLVRSEVVLGWRTDFRIAGLEEGRRCYVRVSSYGDGYSNAISSDPPSAVPAGTLPAYLTDVSLELASDSDAPDQLRLAWYTPELEANGFAAHPSGCAGAGSLPFAPDNLVA